MNHLKVRFFSRLFSQFPWFSVEDFVRFVLGFWGDAVRQRCRLISASRTFNWQLDLGMIQSIFGLIFWLIFARDDSRFVSFFSVFDLMAWIVVLIWKNGSCFYFFVCPKSVCLCNLGESILFLVLQIWNILDSGDDFGSSLLLVFCYQWINLVCVRNYMCYLNFVRKSAVLMSCRFGFSGSC